MSITRAFTTRRVKQSLELRDAADGVVHRSNTTSKAPNAYSSIRHKISAPVELISTTNMLSYNAPDIYPKATSASNSAKSDDESDSNPSTESASSTPPTSPDSPHPAKRSVSPAPNHLSCYFTPPGELMTASPTVVAPVIPQRAPSHVKKSYDGLTRQRSTSRMSEQSARSVSTKASFSFSRSSSTSTNTSTTSSHASGTFNTSAKAPPPISIAAATAATSSSVSSHRKEPSSGISHPFGHELAQVSELAEEYSPKTSGGFIDDEDEELLQKGLIKFSAADYLSEIQNLVTVRFGDIVKPVRPMWI